MPVEYWNPIPIYFADVSAEHFDLVGRQVAEKVTDDMYGDKEWNDFVKTTIKHSPDILKKLELNVLEQLVVAHTTEFLKSQGIEKRFYITESWFNRLPKYGHQGLHTHTPNSDICSNLYYSGVYYHSKAVAKMPGLAFTLKNGIKSTYIEYEYIPGRILIFNSLLDHRVPFNPNDEERTSFAFNVKLVE
jgi:hypothetical protein